MVTTQQMIGYVKAFMARDDRAIAATPPAVRLAFRRLPETDRLELLLAADMLDQAKRSLVGRLARHSIIAGVAGRSPA